ncbi:ankycorbin isoform X2 [Episyrphus balteatus]|nr:ankycorbin isoform X2 [Episyrphus balteatus]XP_055849295.1 ankycorbin isoform X2 [Episyrphus balteatus]XP_055849296.1 ankycorbin isoform X2 [Episyrphus balteatus]XP_055849297.1 ankycorbin isoform X2 [Episyrphus balteatus]
MVNLLLANKADVNAVDNEGHSVVHWATVCGEVEALRSVLQAGANVKTPDINGGSPLHYAAQMCGANYESKLGSATSSKLAFEILDILLSHPQSSVDITDKDGRKPLLWAASAGSAKAVIALVKAGSRVESADKDGLTALHCAASRGHTECIDTLISLCGAPTDLIDSNGCTALHYAVTLGHADATSRLLDLEADPNRQDRKGRTPAHCGCSKGQLETVKLLKEWGANLWLRNAKGDLPLHEAASSGRRELVEWFLEQKPKQVNTTSNDGRSLLHIAASNDNTDICKLLLDYGADVNSILRNSRGVSITPLDCALQKGYRSTAKFLQSNGGLPATKLRLSARRSNAFNDQEQVKPLKYVEKEELQNIKDSKKCIVYSNRSESESGGRCSCKEHIYKKEHTYSHTCRHHRKRFRRRTSSCGDPKNVCREDSCSDICRSKSNIEIHRKKSRERVFTSESEDSWENCCHHRKKHKLMKRRERTSRRTRSIQDLRKYNDGKNHQEQGYADTTHPDAKFTADASQRPLSRPSSNKTSDKNNPQSAKKQQTDDNVKHIPPIQPVSMSLTDDDGETAERAEQVGITQADIHASAEPQTTDTHPLTNTSETTSKIQQQQKDLNKAEEVVNVEAISKEINKVLETAAATAVKTAVDNDATNQEKKSTGDGHVTDSTTTEIQKPQKIIENASPIQPLPPADTVNEQNNDETSADKPKEDEKNSAEQCTIQSDSSKPKDPTESNEIPTSQPTTEPPKIQEIPQQLALVSDNEGKDSKGGVRPSDHPTKEKQENPSDVEAQAKAQKNAAAMKGDKVSLNNEVSQPKIENIVSNEVVATTPQQAQPAQFSQPIQPTKPKQSIQSPPGSISASPSASASPTNETTQNIRDQESRRSFTLLPDSPIEVVEAQSRKSSFQVLKSDESVDVDDVMEQLRESDVRTFQIVSDEQAKSDFNGCDLSSDGEAAMDDDENIGDIGGDLPPRERAFTPHTAASVAVHNGHNEYNNGRKRRLKKRIKSGGTRGRSSLKVASRATKTNHQHHHQHHQQLNKDQDSGFEPSPRAANTKIPTPRNTYTAHVPRKAIYTTLDGRFCSSRLENRKPGDKGACDMSAVTRSIQRNIRRYYMERKIFQHLLELKGLQIRSNKLNEAVLVKRAVDEYHKSCVALGGETGTTLRRYSFSEYTFKNFELFLYETLKTLQRPGTFNFQNINDVYEEAERRLSPDYNAYEKALQCTTKTHRCLHAAHAYTGIPCAAYIPMMNHHTMPKFGFGPYKKTGAGSFYLPKILSSNPSCGSKVSLELSHGKNKQLISLPSEKLDSNKRYYVTFTVKESGGKQQIHHQYQQQKEHSAPTTTTNTAHSGEAAAASAVGTGSEKTCDQKKTKQDKDDK